MVGATAGDVVDIKDHRRPAGVAIPGGSLRVVRLFVRLGVERAAGRALDHRVETGGQCVLVLAIFWKR